MSFTMFKRFDMQPRLLNSSPSNLEIALHDSVESSKRLRMRGRLTQGVDHWLERFKVAMFWLISYSYSMKWYSYSMQYLQVRVPLTLSTSTSTANAEYEYEYENVRENIAWGFDRLKSRHFRTSAHRNAHCYLAFGNDLHS